MHVCIFYYIFHSLAASRLLLVASIKKSIHGCSSDDVLPLQVVFAQGFKVLVFFLEGGDARVRRKST